MFLVGGNYVHENRKFLKINITITIISCKYNSLYIQSKKKKLKKKISLSLLPNRSCMYTQ